VKVNGKPYRSIWLKADDERIVQVIDQARLPHEFRIMDLCSVEDARVAIRDMHIRGAGLIGATAGYGMYLAALGGPERDFDSYFEDSGEALKATRPTAFNLAWAVDRVFRAVSGEATLAGKQAIAKREALAIADEDAEHCRRIGERGLVIIREISRRKKGAIVNILTHCNAGWLAFVDLGSATAPIYAAHDAGIKLHVWVDETRPRNQGASLTAWELGQHGVPHSLIADNAGGHLMQHGMVDLVITGADRVTRDGDAANKIGTYLKALAARDNQLPFYVALPSSTFDFALREGLATIPIEERDAGELRFVSGKTAGGRIETVLICPETTPARNWGFDVTPARLITGLICERGICKANEAAIMALFPEQAHAPAAVAAPVDGYIKYSSERSDGEVPHPAALDELNHVRTELFDRGLIGCLPNGIGFGNLSIRHGGTGFLISGSATGADRVLNHGQFCLVESYSLEENRVRSRGSLNASSESMSHGAIYSADPAVNCVIHIHSRSMFDSLLARGQIHTPADVPYGTPAMARAVAELVRSQVDLPVLFVMAGHDEGVVAYGADIASVGTLLVETFEKGAAYG
jgi:methylthioribose-1-phosphate isomerase